MQNHQHSPLGGGHFMTTCRCPSHTCGKTFNSLTTDDNALRRTSVWSFCSRSASTGKETFHRKSEVASTSSNAGPILSLIPSLRLATFLLFAISIGKIDLGSSPSTKQLRLSSDGDPEGTFEWVAGKVKTTDHQMQQYQHNAP